MLVESDRPTAAYMNLKQQQHPNIYYMYVMYNYTVYTYELLAWVAEFRMGSEP